MTNDQLRNRMIEAIKPLYGEDEAKAIQRFLFEAVGGFNSAKWLLSKYLEADTKFEELVLQAIPQLHDQIPVQYVAGKTWFCDLEFTVKPGVLIPRPETEEMVLKIKKLYSPDATLKILDIGTGSGAIAVSLQNFFPGASVHAIDVSRDALQIARQNSAKYGDTVHFHEIDILNRCSSDKLPQFNLIVSNPPYVLYSEKAQMKANVIDNEPHLALFVNDNDALLYYKAIAEFANLHLRKDGNLWLEINESKSVEVKSLLEESGFLDIKIHHDFSNKPRFVEAKFAGTSAER